MTRRHSVTAAEYRRVRQRLGLSNYAFARMLGVHLRTAQRYEAGESPIPPTLALLLRYMAHYGAPPETPLPARRRASENRPL